MIKIQKPFWLIAIAYLSFQTIHAQQISSPKEHFGFQIGDDYRLANYSQTEAYFHKLAKQSDRVLLQVIGKTEEGRDQLMLILSSPENLRNIDRYQQLSRSMARAKISDAEARKLAQEGKSVVWIDGGLHSNEVVATHQLIQTAYLLASSNDPETKRILDQSIILLTHANPDGHELVGNWYMKESDTLKRTTSNIPTLYQKYAGHDNNRDFFMLNLKESQNIARQLFIDWVPQIMYNHHQTAPAGAVVAGAPYRDPFNYVFDPLLMSGIDALGAAMSNRLNAENKPGYTAKGGSVFSTWYNGGLRTTTYFHNMIGLLTEIVGNPSPYEIPLVPKRLIPNSNTQNPVVPQKWHFQQSIDYSVSLNYAVMNYASRYKDELLYNIYRMGRNSIERGSSDYWALSPSKVALIDTAQRQSQQMLQSRIDIQKERKLLDLLYGNPDLRDPRAYIIPSDQADFNTAKRFLNALIQNGIEVQQAASAFELNGKTYPQGSYIIRTAQAFRPHILDMFEPQDHPDDFEYPGGPPIPPYDAAGWTLAYLMDVKFDRILEDIPDSFTQLPYGEQIAISASSKPVGKFLRLPAAINDSYMLANKSLTAGGKAWRDPVSGDFYIENNKKTSPTFQTQGLQALPRSAKPLKTLRIGLWDNYGGSMASGWLRYTLEQNGYPYEVIYPQEIDAGNLNTKFDILIFPGGSIPRHSANQQTEAGRSRNNIPDIIPANYQGRWGRLSIDKSIPVLKSFMENGGKIITIGNSSDLAEHINLGVEDALVDQNHKPLPRTAFYTPGSVLTAKVSQQSPSTRGYSSEIDLYYNNDNLYKISDPNIKPLLWFDSGQVLKSGWSWGEKYLKDAVLAFETNIGKGKLVSFGNDINFRAQTHGTFKLLFNQLLTD